MWRRESCALFPVFGFKLRRETSLYTSTHLRLRVCRSTNTSLYLSTDAADVSVADGAGAREKAEDIGAELRAAGGWEGRRRWTSRLEEEEDDDDEDDDAAPVRARGRMR